MASAEGGAPSAAAPSMGVSRALNAVAVLLAVAALAVNFAIAGPQGPTGTDGANGTDGTNGANGLSCWDLNGNGAKDVATEDLDGSGVVDVADCDAAAATMTASTSGRSCVPGPCDSTTSTTFATIPNATVALGTLRPSTFVITFSAEMWVDATTGDYILGRAMVDATQAPPGSAGGLVGWIASTNVTFISVTFVLENVPAGAHTVSVDWRMWQGTTTGNVDHFVLVVMAVPE